MKVEANALAALEIAKGLVELLFDKGIISDAETADMLKKSGDGVFTIGSPRTPAMEEAKRIIVNFDDSTRQPPGSDQ